MTHQIRCARYFQSLSLQIHVNYSRVIIEVIIISCRPNLSTLLGLLIGTPAKRINPSSRATPNFEKIKYHRARLPRIHHLHANMSRFFHGDSSSESSSSDEEELYSEEEVEEKVASDEDEDEEEEDDEDEDSSSEDEDGAKKSGANRFMRDADSESEESSDEDRAKIVKSAKDKRLEELEATVKAIENGQKINDWGVISAGM